MAANDSILIIGHPASGKTTYVAQFYTRLCLKSPSWARGRAIFLPGKDGEAGDIFFIVDGAGCSQTKKGPTEARATFQTEPSSLTGDFGGREQ